MLAKAAGEAPGRGDGTDCVKSRPGLNRRTIHEGNSTPATFPNFPKSCPPRSDDALLMKLGGVKGLEGIWSFVVLNLEEFLVLLFKSGYLHSLACWLLMCLPGALLTYYCAVAVRNSNLREEIDQHQHEDTLEKLDSMRAILRNSCGNNQLLASKAVTNRSKQLSYMPKVQHFVTDKFCFLNIYFYFHLILFSSILNTLFRQLFLLILIIYPLYHPV